MKFNKENLRKNIFWTAYIIFLVSVMLDSSKYSVIESVGTALNILQVFSCVIAFLKILLDGLDAIKSKNYKVNYFMICICIAMIISFFITKSPTLVFFLTMIIASKNIKFKDIVKVTLIIQLTVLIFIIMSCKIGIIEGVTVYREFDIRYSLGTTSPNCLILQIFQIIMLYLILEHGNKIKIYNLLLLLLLSCIVYYITDSRMGMFSILLMFIAYLFSKIKIINKILDKTNILFKLLPIVLTVITIVITLLYKPMNLNKLNAIFSDRLNLNNMAIEKYGISLFGKEIHWIGQMTAEETQQHDDPYNYVDSSYLNILLNYGIIVFIFILYCMWKITQYAYEKKNYFMVLVIAIIEIYCFFDSWLLGIQFNTLLFILQEAIYPLKKKIIKQEENNIDKKEMV